MGPICYGFPRIPCHTRSDRRLPAGHGRRREPGATPKKWHDSPSPWGHAQRRRQCAIRAEHNPCPRMAVSARSCPLLSLGTAAPTCPTLKLSAPYPNSTTADGSARRTSAFRPPRPCPGHEWPRSGATMPQPLMAEIAAAAPSQPHTDSTMVESATPSRQAPIRDGRHQRPLGVRSGIHTRQNGLKSHRNGQNGHPKCPRNVREMSTSPAIYLRPLTAIAQFKRITLRKILRAHV